MGGLNDETIDRKEERIPKGAGAAFKIAFESTLKAGHSVLTVDGGKLLRRYPDGRREFVKWVGRRAQVEREGKVPIQWRNAFPD